MMPADQIKLFHMTNSLLRRDLGEVEREFGIDLGLDEPGSGVEVNPYYLQFPAAIRADAGAMAEHYKLFFCLENSIRDLVADQLLAASGTGWWDKVVPDSVKENVAKNLKREQEAGVSLRSPDLIDYTTFGELGEIVQANWDVFSDTFNNRKALARVLSSLNLLRGPIAHCAPLAEDEVVRLQLALRDWFRLME
jgi:hypothetical protein